MIKFFEVENEKPLIIKDREGEISKFVVCRDPHRFTTVVLHSVGIGLPDS